MVFTHEQLKSLLNAASDAAVKAGRYIAEAQRDTLKVLHKDSGSSLASQVVTQVDLVCEDIIYQALKEISGKYHLAFLGEESASQHSNGAHPRLTKPYFWCVDPLDGTLAFIENIPGYAVSIALVAQNGQALLGVVYDPVRQILYQSIATDNGFNKQILLLKNNALWQPRLSSSMAKHKTKSERILHLYVDRSFQSHARFNDIVSLLTDRFKARGFDKIKIVSQYGAVMNALSVLENAPACYFKLPKQSEGGGSVWDFAATSALFKAATAYHSDMHGVDLILNPTDSLYMHKFGVLYASDKHIALDVMTTLAKYTKL
ncbi:3'(2'),5'-bisphosphate nucleotidase CysQ [Thalassotalea aquiviva]|uniref:3'(2'),5'-bisphosphate nucleotidase CysQ family protein n=1 Tax=Thalassotalea aquiviva TaxID=3242415 RepID=UPI00352B0F09